MEPCILNIHTHCSHMDFTRLINHQKKIGKIQDGNKDFFFLLLLHMRTFRVWIFIDAGERKHTEMLHSWAVLGAHAFWWRRVTERRRPGQVSTRTARLEGDPSGSTDSHLPTTRGPEAPRFSASELPSRPGLLISPSPGYILPSGSSS